MTCREAIITVLRENRVALYSDEIQKFVRRKKKCNFQPHTIRSCLSKLVKDGTLDSFSKRPYTLYSVKPV